MNINMLLWWSLGRGNTVVPSRWQATLGGTYEDGCLDSPLRTWHDPWSPAPRWWRVCNIMPQRLARRGVVPCRCELKRSAYGRSSFDI
jgi:hypothetical protein